MDALDNIEGIVSSVALIITTIIGAWLTVRAALKPTEDDDTAEIVQGQAVDHEEQWLTDLRADAAEADELRDRLTKALLRLARNGIDTDDI